MVIPLLRPSCTEAEIRAVTAVLESSWWGMGPMCERVEALLCRRYGYKYCVTVNSATAALHLALIANGIGDGDEVIVPALTFISTALAVSYTGAQPVFADVDPKTLCLDPDDVHDRVSRRTKAVIPVDYAGYPACPSYDLAIGRKDGLTVIQDAAHSCGGIGYGDEICLSFHPVKSIATGDGGAVLTNDGDKYEHMKALRWCGIDKGTWERSKKKKYSWDYSIDEIGYKYHWNDIQAAIGLVQLGRQEELLGRRRTIAGMYSEGLRGLCELPVDHPNHTWHLYPIRVSPDKRDMVIDTLLSHNISAGVHYKPLTTYPMYQRPTPTITECEWRRLISLPIFFDLKDDELFRIVRVLQEIL